LAAAPPQALTAHPASPHQSGSSFLAAALQTTAAASVPLPQYFALAVRRKPRDTDSMSEQTSQPPKADGAYVTAMSHFYRGEIGRIMQWRARLDNTTNWAITTTSTIFTVAFSLREVPHIIFLFNLAIVTIMLWIEARRYRFYDAFRARVRMLEAHFLVPIVMQNDTILQGDWRKLLCEDLLIPSFKISAVEAVGRRMKRNYVFIFVVILFAWITKIFLHANIAIIGWHTFYEALAVGKSIPSWLIAGVFFGTFIGVIVLTSWIGIKSSNEFSDLAPRKRWNI
jgi:uncharacterized membrane protein